MCFRSISLCLIIAACSSGTDSGSDEVAEPNDPPPTVESEEFRVMTYNIQIAAFDDDEFRDTRRWRILEAIDNDQPDFIGFQEAYSAHDQPQQDQLEEIFEGTKWTLFRWDELNENNKNPIALNTDRYVEVANGVVVLDMTDGIGEDDWETFFDLHTEFHGDPSGRVHFLDEFRFLTWVVAEDRNTGERIAFLNCHYETFVGSTQPGDDLDLFHVFETVVNESFGWLSTRIAEEATILEGLYDCRSVAVGDFETSREESTDDKFADAVEAFYASGYREAFWYLNPWPARRPTAGIDGIYLEPDEIDILAAEYNEADYTQDASDHKPYYADLIVKAPE